MRHATTWRNGTAVELVDCPECGDERPFTRSCQMCMGTQTVTQSQAEAWGSQFEDDLPLR